jgi:hypothetical protein
LKILTIETSLTGGGRERAMAFKNFLQSQNHSVSTMDLPGEDFSSKLWYYSQRGLARLAGHEKRHMKKTAERLEKRIKKGNYDAVIGFETPLSYVLTKELGCLKIFSCESVEADQLYFSRQFGDIKRVNELREMELEILEKSDYVIFPWKTTEDYVRRYIWNGNNFLTIQYGCYPQDKTASYFFPVSIVSMGRLEYYWSNRELLSYLTRASPYCVDVYGTDKPPRKLHLNYKGFAPSLDILRNYQFGLNTISKDTYRRNHFSSRILTYLAYGLPTLSPDWMKLSHELKGVLPYTEDNFSEVLEEHVDRDEWTKLSRIAHEQALELDWRKVLKPLEKIVSAR